MSVDEVRTTYIENGDGQADPIFSNSSHRSDEREISLKQERASFILLSALGMVTMTRALTDNTIKLSVLLLFGNIRMG